MENGHHTPRERVLILGAAGRDFHNFNVLFREDADTEVVGFTATQIPRIEGREYPAIMSEDDLEAIIKRKKVDRCLLSYSDLHHDAVLRGRVMELAGRCLAAGADYRLVAPRRTMLASSKPVIAVCAVRTGCGKSQVSRYIIDRLQKAHGMKCVLVRHPMPYGELAKQAVQRFEKMEDLNFHEATIEEREEYEQHMKEGTVVFAGVDYEAILRQAEQEADVVIWDGGNNDTPFYKPDLWVCVADPHRAGHERHYYPGDLNFRMADAIVINKANTAEEGATRRLMESAREVNPAARVYVTDSVITVDDPAAIKGKRVLIVDDGPTLTHGGMAYGAGRLVFIDFSSQSVTELSQTGVAWGFAAEKYGAAEIVDPKPCAVGSIAGVFSKFPHLGKLIPAMGYFPEQIKDLQATIAAVPAALLLSFQLCQCTIPSNDTKAISYALPLSSRPPRFPPRVVEMDKPCAIAKYAIADRAPPLLSAEVDAFAAACRHNGTKSSEP
eukprot:scaffold1.g5397.t1